MGMIDGKLFAENLAKLIGATAIVTDNTNINLVPLEPSAILTFSTDAKLRMDYWRVIKDGKQKDSSFDHMHQYGLPNRIDTIEELAKELETRLISDAKWDLETGDIIFNFSDEVKLQVLNFTFYEVWEINFPDGTTVYSNQIR